MLPHLRTYIAKARENKREPATYSYEIVLASLSDAFIGPKLAFFKTLASEVELFLTKYQSELPMAPFLYKDLLLTLKSVMQRFIKKDVLDSQHLISIDIFDKNSYILSKNIDLGYLTRQELKNVKKTDKEVLYFRNDCLLILQNVCKKLLDKSPLKYPIVRDITFCDPSIIDSSKEKSIKRLKFSLEEFVERKWISGIQADEIDLEFKTLLSKSSFMSQIKLFNQKNDRLDHLWRDIGSTFYLLLDFMNFLKKVLTFSHGNASVERGFSVNKECLVENLNETSLIGQRHVWAAIKAAGMQEHITLKLLMKKKKKMKKKLK